MAREPTGGGRSQRNIHRTGGEPRSGAVSSQKHGKTLRLARHDEAKTLQESAEKDDHARAISVVQAAPQKPADTHPEEGKGRGRGNPRARPAEGVGHRL